MTLDQLSAAATEGELLPCPFCGGPAEVESKRCGWRVHCIKPSCYTAGPYPDDCTEAEAITAWNQRTGQLVAVADDAVERVARAILKAHALDTTGFSHDAAEAIADHAVQSWMPEAKAAIAALAAKGTGDE